MMKKNMKSARSSTIEKSFRAGELVRLIEHFEWYPHVGIVLEDYPTKMQESFSPNDTLVHVLYNDGKDIWTPFVFLERFEE